MARSNTRTYRREEGANQRALDDQPTPFLGIALSPPLALIFSWVLHWIVGMNKGLTGVSMVTAFIAIVATPGIAWAAWHFSHGRHKPMRYALVSSTAVISLWLAALVFVGPDFWTGLFFLLCAWTFTGVWSLPRLHVLRRDPNENATSDNGEDDLMKQLGLTGFKHRGKPTVTYDDDGNPARIVVTVKHRFGAVRDALQGAVRNLESALGAPEGLSRATATDNGKSDESVLTMVLADPLKKRVPYPGLTNPGGSVSDYATVGLYDNGEPVHVWVCGGVSPEGVKMPPTGYAFMGMTRAGKTVTENRLLIDGVITRRDGVILYLNQAKGSQDVQPIISGVEVCILSDGSSAYREALNKVKAIAAYRQKKLAEYGISAWSAEKCWDNPPRVTLDGRRIPMEPMPAVWVHVGEADAILQDVPDQAVWLASKGLSLGLIAGWSMQRWANTSMPTDLRFNIGTSFCFGVGDDYSAGFALSESTLKAGAQPHNWKNRYPGKFYVENIGIPENQFATPARGIGDDDDDTLYRRMREICEEWGPRMALLDRGSAAATGDWWDNQVKATNALRRSMRPGAASADTNQTPSDAAPAQTPTTQQEEQMPRNRPGDPTFTAGDPDPSGPTAGEMEARHDVEVEIAETRDLGGDPVFDADTDADLDGINPDVPVPPVTGDDGIDLTGGKPDPTSREEAETALDNALREMAADTTLVEPGDEAHIIFRVSQLQKRYPFRARSWFSPRLRDMAEGIAECPPGHRLEKLEDRKGEGWYRMNRFPGQYGNQ